MIFIEIICFFLAIYALSKPIRFIFQIIGALLINGARLSGKLIMVGLIIAAFFFHPILAIPATIVLFIIRKYILY